MPFNRFSRQVTQNSLALAVAGGGRSSGNASRKHNPEKEGTPREIQNNLLIRVPYISIELPRATLRFPNAHPLAFQLGAVFGFEGIIADFPRDFAELINLAGGERQILDPRFYPGVPGPSGSPRGH